MTSVWSPLGMEFPQRQRYSGTVGESLLPIGLACNPDKEEDLIIGQALSPHPNALLVYQLAWGRPASPHPRFSNCPRMPLACLFFLPWGPQSDLTTTTRHRRPPTQLEKGGKEEREAQAHSLSCVHCHIFAVCDGDTTVQVLLHKSSIKAGKRETEVWGLSF